MPHLHYSITAIITNRAKQRSDEVHDSPHRDSLASELYNRGMVRGDFQINWDSSALFK